MPEKVAQEHQQINLAETVNDGQTAEIREVVIVSMKAQEDRGTQEGLVQFGKEAWQKNIGDRSKLITRMLEVGAEKGDYSIWQAVWENLPEADPERTLLSLDAPSRQWMLQLFQDTANAAWGEEKAHKIEAEGFKKIAGKWEFDPERLQTDLFSVAEVAVGKMREFKLLPEPLAKQVKELQETIHTKEVMITSQFNEMRYLRQTETELGSKRDLRDAAREIEQWPDDMKLEVARKNLADLPKEVQEVFEKAVKIREAKFVAEDIPEIIKDLPLLERMAVMLNVSGRVEQEIAATPEGQPCGLFNLMFPEISGLEPIAKISRLKDGNLMLELNAMFPDKKGPSRGRLNLFQLPVSVDNSGGLRSTQDVGKIWKDLPKQVKRWLEDNLVDEKTFVGRLKDPQQAVFAGLSRYLGARQAFLKNGSLKFVWDNRNDIFTISAGRDNRAGGPGR